MGAIVGSGVKDGLRAGAAAVAVASGLMALASTSQTPDGFIHASFGGPMDVFGAGAADVLSIGDGTTDASELAALLNGPASTNAGIPDSPYRAAFEAGTTPSPTTPPSLMPSLVGPTAAPAVKDAAVLPAKPVVDSQGRVDCTGAVSCKTDPVTNITTVTFPDGLVAIVQKINDLTVVAYKTLTDTLPPVVQDLLPPPVTPSSSVIAAPAPALAPASPAPVPTTAPTIPETAAPTFDPGPLAPDTEELDPTESRSGPRINVIRPPMDFSPGANTGGLPGPSGQKPNFPVLGKVKDALDSAVNAVTDAVGKAINPGASGKAGAGTAGPAGNADTGTDSP